MKTLIVILLLSYSCLGQAPSIEWQKSLGGSNSDYSYSIQQTTDGGYIATGWSLSNDGDVTGNNGSNDYWVVKLDNNGSVQWQKSLGGSDEDYSWSVVETIDGGFAIAGWSKSNDGDVTGNSGFQDYWIVKLDSAGNLEWEKSLGGSDEEYAFSIQQTMDNGYIIAGWSKSIDGDITGNNGFTDYWVVKLDSVGIILWQKALGGSGDDRAWSIQQTTDSGYIIAGSSTSSDGDVTGNNGGFDYWIVKIDSIGNIEWEKTMGGSDEDEAWSIQQTMDGGYVVAGWTASNDGDVTGSNGYRDSWIVKLNNLGNIDWQKALGGSSDDRAYSIIQTNDGGYIVAGGSASIDGDVTDNNGEFDYWIVKLNNVGSLEWQKSMGGSNQDIANSIEQTPDGGFIVAGGINSGNGDISGYNGSGDFWIVKLGADASLVELIKADKAPVKIVNLLGQETKDKPNTTLIYIYSDGTTEKVYRME